MKNLIVSKEINSDCVFVIGSSATGVPYCEIQFQQTEHLRDPDMRGCRLGQAGQAACVTAGLTSFVIIFD